MLTFSRDNALPVNVTQLKPGSRCILPNTKEYILNNSKQWVPIHALALEYKQELTTENLNTIQSQGIYANNLNNQATPANNYPTVSAGILIVYVSNGQIFQQYQVLSGQTNENKIYSRGNYGGVWSPWLVPNYVNITQNEWNTISANSHTHSNKALLDVINQGLSNSDSPTFVSPSFTASIKNNGTYLPFFKLDNSAQKGAFGGLLISDSYSDYTLIPANGLYVKGQINTASHGNSSLWNLAHSWGNHATAGYMNQTTADSRYLRLSNPGIEEYIDNAGLKLTDTVNENTTYFVSGTSNTQIKFNTINVSGFGFFSALNNGSDAKYFLAYKEIGFNPNTYKFIEYDSITDRFRLGIDKPIYLNNLTLGTTGTKTLTVDDAGRLSYISGLPALDSNVVHKTGNENIAGIKKFTDVISHTLTDIDFTDQTYLENVASYVNNGSSVTGNWKITFPVVNTTHTMFYIRVYIYNYSGINSGLVEGIISGYIYGNSFPNAKVSFPVDSGISQVRFGKNTNNNPVIFIDNNVNQDYPKFLIKEVHLSHSSMSLPEWRNKSLWNVILTTDNTGFTLFTTITSDDFHYVQHKHNNKTFLDSIDQNLSKNSEPKFNNLFLTVGNVYSTSAVSFYNWNGIGSPITPTVLNAGGLLISNGSYGANGTNMPLYGIYAEGFIKSGQGFIVKDSPLGFLKSNGTVDTNNYASSSHTHDASDINAGTLPVVRGGTGATTLTGVTIGNGTSAITAVAGTANQLLRRNSANTAYEFFTPAFAASTHTHNASAINAGTLPVVRGGTGATTLTGVTIGNGTSAITAVAGTANQLLRRNSANTAYEFFTPSFAATAHDHDDRYYTEAESDGRFVPKLANAIGYGSVSPTNIAPGVTQIGAVSYDNNGGYGFADYIHFGGEANLGGEMGYKNLVMFNKMNFGIRQYLAHPNQTTPFSNYVDYWHTGNLIPLKANELEYMPDANDVSSPWNNPKFYQYKLANSQTLNMPTGISSGHVITRFSDQNTASQQYHDVYSNTLYLRDMTWQGFFGQWRKVWTEGNFNPDNLFPNYPKLTSTERASGSSPDNLYDGIDNGNVNLPEYVGVWHPVFGFSSSSGTSRTQLTRNLMRFMDNGNWTAWKTLAFNEDLDSLFVGLTGVQTIADTKTFTSSPIVPNPTLDTHAVNRGYLNTNHYTKTEVDAKVASTFKPKGSVANLAALPTTGQQEGDVWNLLDSGKNVVWVSNLNNTGNPGWDDLSGTVDLSGYATQSWVTSQNFAKLDGFNTWTSYNFFDVGISIKDQILSSYYHIYMQDEWFSVKENSMFSTPIFQINGEAIKSNDLTYNFPTNSGTLALISDIPSLSGYATQSWVTSQNYLTNAALNGYATQAWVSAGYQPLNGILTRFGTDLTSTGPNSTGLVRKIAGPPGSPWFVLDTNTYLTQADLAGYVTTNTAQEITANKDFASTSTVRFLGGDNNHVIPFHDDGIWRLTSGHLYTCYNHIWRIGNVRDGGTGSWGFNFELSTDNGANYGDIVTFPPDSNIKTLNYGRAAQWKQAFDWGNHAEVGYATQSWVTSQNYLTSSDLVHKFDYSGGLNNASDTHVNKSWFDYDWAGEGYAGSVINFSGLNGNYSTELFASYSYTDSIGIRSKNGDTNTWNPVKWLWHSGNFNPSIYMPRTGGTFTGDVWFDTWLRLRDTTTGNTAIVMTNAGQNTVFAINTPANGGETMKVLHFLPNTPANPNSVYKPVVQFPNQLTQFRLGFYGDTYPGYMFAVKGLSMFENKIETTSHGNSEQWNQAYNWGDHAAAGYTTQTWVTSQGYITSSNLTALQLDVSPESEHGQTIKINGSNQTPQSLTNYYVTSRDGTRNPDTIVAPNGNSRRVRFDFVSAGAAGMGGTGNYGGVMTYSPWDGTSASTGDSSYQLAFLNQTGINGSGVPMLKIRKGIDGAWSNTWYKIYTEADFNPADYVTNSSLNSTLSNNYVTTNTAQEITAKKTFTVSPIVPNPTLGGHAVNITYFNTFAIRRNIPFDTSLSNTIMLGEDYYGAGETGLIDTNEDNIIAGIHNGYYKYGSQYNNFSGLNIKFGSYPALNNKIVTIGQEVKNNDDKLQVKGNVSVNVNDVQLILNPITNEDGNLTGCRNAHIYYCGINDVHLPNSPIKGQRFELHNAASSSKTVYYNSMPLFTIRSGMKYTGVYIGSAGFVFDTNGVLFSTY